jgi:hypothetical protein
MRRCRACSAGNLAGRAGAVRRSRTGDLPVGRKDRSGGGDSLGRQSSYLRKAGGRPELVELLALGFGEREGQQGSEQKGHALEQERRAQAKSSSQHSNRKGRQRR